MDLLSSDHIFRIRRKRKPCEIRPQQDQKFEVILGKPLRNEYRQCRQRLSDAIIVERCQDIRAIAKTEGPGLRRQGMIMNKMPQISPKPLSVISQCPEMLSPCIRMVDQRTVLQLEEKDQEACQNQVQDCINQDVPLSAIHFTISQHAFSFDIRLTSMMSTFCRRIHRRTSAFTVPAFSQAESSSAAR